MHVYKLTIAYDGTDFYGWQIQKKKRTVQGTIENSLKKFLGNGFKLIGASRTDKGVHAKGQVASLHLQHPLKLEVERFRKALNSRLPKDIYIKDIREADEHFHARYSAKGKYYTYTISTQRNPFTIRYEWQINFDLDLKYLRDLISLTRGIFNFQHLLIGNPAISPIVHLYSSSVEKSGDKYIFHIMGDRFTYKLVRLIIGEIVYNTHKQLGIKEYYHFLTHKKPKNFHIAPPNGLCLKNVFY